MPTPTPTTDDLAAAHEAAATISPTLIKWALGVLSTLFTLVSTATFTWMWATDRAVRLLAQAQADREKRAEEYKRKREQEEHDEKAERRLWRDEIKQSIERLGSRVGPLELQQAKQQGRDEARKEH